MMPLLTLQGIQFISNFLTKLLGLHVILFGNKTNSVQYYDNSILGGSICGSIMLCGKTFFNVKMDRVDEEIIGAKHRTICRMTCRRLQNPDDLTRRSQIT